MFGLPKYHIGQTVVALTSVMGSYEPSRCSVGEKMRVEKVERHGNTYQYTCGYDGYELLESQLTTPLGYTKKKI